MARRNRQTASSLPALASTALTASSRRFKEQGVHSSHTHNVGAAIKPQVTHISVCAGYGGIDLGLRRCVPSLRTVAYSEVEAFAVENLLARMEAGQLDAAPVWTNLKSFPWSEFSGCVDILSGGYPCQPFSGAGLRRGADDPRHLWPFIADGIRLLRPGVCFFENVEGHISLGLPTVISDLEEMGYRVSFGIFSAAEVGAPHQRKRLFVLADSTGGQLGKQCRAVTNAERAQEHRPDGCRGNPWPSRPGERQQQWEPEREVESSLGGGANGASRGLDYAELCGSCDSFIDELRLLGNGVVPATAERAFGVLMEQL